MKGLGGTEDGVIGAMAGLGLAVNLNDGRFLQRVKVQEVLGPTTVPQLLDAGIDGNYTPDGHTIKTGKITIEDPNDQTRLITDHYLRRLQKNNLN